MHSLEELAERVLRTGPCREMDVAIIEALGWKRKGSFWGGVYWERNGKRLWAAQIPRVTSSLDAAMTLATRAHPANILRSAMTLVIEDGHIMADEFNRALPRYVVAAALRARSS